MTSMVRMDLWEEVSDIAKKANAITVLEENTTGAIFLSQPQVCPGDMKLKKGTKLMILRETL